MDDLFLVDTQNTPLVTGVNMSLLQDLNAPNGNG